MHRCNDYVPTKPKSWITSDDMWIRRCAIIYQLGYKRNTDQSLLFSLIDDTKDERTFFINKAQGWALREYAKVEPEAVLHYINTTSGLAPLAVREATRIMAKNIQSRTKIKATCPYIQRTC